MTDRNAAEQMADLALDAAAQLVTYANQLRKTVAAGSETEAETA